MNLAALRVSVLGTFATLSLFASSSALALNEALATTLTSAAPTVQPESLEQGFILVVTDKSGKATTDSPIYVASSHNGWSPSDPSQRFTQRSDSKWQLSLKKPKLDSKMAFKLTRGSWEQVEVTADFKDIDNRLLPLVDVSGLAPGAQPTIELVVERWRDERPEEPKKFGVNPYRAVKVADGRVARVEVAGGGTVVTRDLFVWLPPGYDDSANAARTYPVLYLNDGQNLFDAPDSVPGGGWKVDQVASKLIKEGTIQPLIIVGIPNTGAKRVVEYLPVQAMDDVPAGGDAYVDFLAHEVVPRVQRAFRVNPDPKLTGIGGSSLGGIIALHAASRYPEIFGLALIESPSLTLKDGLAMKFFSQARFAQARSAEGSSVPQRFFLGMGGKEEGDKGTPEGNAKVVTALHDLKALLVGKGVSDNNISVLVNPDDTHNEIAWNKRLPAALTFLYGVK